MLPLQLEASDAAASPPGPSTPDSTRPPLAAAVSVSSGLQGVRGIRDALTLLARPTRRDLVALLTRLTRLTLLLASRRPHLPRYSHASPCAYYACVVYCCCPYD